MVGPRPSERRSTLDFLDDLDASRAPGGDARSSTVDFMQDLEDSAVSREIDLDADPMMRDAVAAASAEAEASRVPAALTGAAVDASDATAAAEATLPGDDGVASHPRPELLVTLPIPEPARTPEGQLQQRRQRTMDRIATSRDAFRFIGHMGILEDQRKQIARMFIDLEAAVTGTPGSALVKDPRTALAQATKEQLDQAERAISPIEEKLLTLDDQIDDAVFEDRLLNTKQNKKVIARYGRLLASRRMPAGPRRNRFEWIAFQLLTRTGPNGELRILPPDRARNVLQHLIGGLPRKARPQETEEATAYLNECGRRLEALPSSDELFESGLFVDLYGYKVSMREQLLSPEFVYASIHVEVKLRNATERWLVAQDRLHDNNQLTSDGTPRDRLHKRLRAERWDVDSRLGAKARGTSGGAAEAASVAPAPTPAKRPGGDARPGALRELLGRVQMDRRALTAFVALAVIIACVVQVGSSLGVIAQPEVQALQRNDLAKLSPALTRGVILGSGDERTLRAWTSEKRWTKLDSRRRSEAATALAKELTAQGIVEAEVLLGTTPVIRISGGTVLEVEGGRL